MDDYRESHVSPEQIAWYEHGVYRPGTYDSLMWEREQRILLDILARRPGARGRRLLDFACGTGRILAFLEPHVAQATGVDISEGMLEIARSKVARALLVCGDLTADPSLVAGPFDLITTFRFLLNAQPALREQAVHRLATLLTDDGIFVFNVHGNAWSVRGVSYTLRRYLRRERINQLSPRRVRALLARHGLEVVEMHGVGLLTRRLRAATPARLADRLDEAVERRRSLGRFAVDLIFVARKRGTGSEDTVPAGRTAAAPRRPGGPRRWRAVPFTPARLDLRVTGGRGARDALRVYRPARPSGRAALEVGGAVAAAGLVASRPPPIDGLAELASLAGVTADAMSVMRSSHAGRLVVGMASGGSLAAVAKLGEAADPGLRREENALQALERWDGPVSVPRLRWAGPWRDRYGLVTEAFNGPRSAGDVGVEDALRICLALAEQAPGAPVVHGDLTPWNIVRRSSGVALLDWEESRFEDDPLYDLAHFLVQRGVLLGHPTPEEAARLLTATGSVGWRYLEAREIDPSRARELVGSYLDRTRHFSGRTGFDYRLRVAEILFG